MRAGDGQRESTAIDCQQRSARVVQRSKLMCRVMPHDRSGVRKLPKCSMKSDIADASHE